MDCKIVLVRWLGRFVSRKDEDIKNPLAIVDSERVLSVVVLIKPLRSCSN